MAAKQEGVTRKTVEIIQNLKITTTTTEEKATIDAEKERMADNVQREKKFSLMACGITGAGKSTLLNGIAGEELFEVGDFLPQTSKVEMKEKIKDTCTLTLYDTPGFQDDSGKEEDYLEGIKKECASVDTLFYCISVSATRIKMKEDLDTLKMLKNGLSENIWKNCIIVFTLANTIVERMEAKGIEDIEELKKGYDKGIAIWKEQVLNTFKAAGIDSAEDIPIVCAGTPPKPYLLETDSEAWLATFFCTVSDKSTEDGQAVLHLLNIDRFQSNPYKKKEILKVPLQMQKIPLNKKRQDTIIEKLKKKFPSIAAAIAAGGVAGGAGAGIGATIGALAIGIPSFGTAAGVGLLLGGLIGGGIGVGVGAITGKVIEKRKNKGK